jgi:hypothetical protein
MVPEVSSISIGRVMSLPSIQQTVARGRLMRIFILLKKCEEAITYEPMREHSVRSNVLGDVVTAVKIAATAHDSPQSSISM